MSNQAASGGAGRGDTPGDPPGDNNSSNSNKGAGRGRGGRGDRGGRCELCHNPAHSGVCWQPCPTCHQRHRRGRPCSVRRATDNSVAVGRGGGGGGGGGVLGGGFLGGGSLGGGAGTENLASLLTHHRWMCLRT